MAASACIHDTDWLKSLTGRSQRPGSAETSVGTDPRIAMTEASTTTSWRHPNSTARRSSSKAAIPRPMEAATATAAGPNRINGSIARLPVHPRPMTQANTQKTRAIDQKRTAHRNRSPRASTRGTSAATANPHASGEPPIGPAAKRRSDPHDDASDAGTGTPRTDTAPHPAHSTPMSHGRQSTAATRVDPAARPTDRLVDCQSPPMLDERSRANAATSTTTAAAGANDTRTASIRPSATISRTAGNNEPSVTTER